MVEMVSAIRQSDLERFGCPSCGGIEFSLRLSSPARLGLVSLLHCERCGDDMLVVNEGRSEIRICLERSNLPDLVGVLYPHPFDHDEQMVDL